MPGYAMGDLSGSRITQQELDPVLSGLLHSSLIRVELWIDYQFVVEILK